MHTSAYSFPPFLFRSPSFSSFSSSRCFSRFPVPLPALSSHRRFRRPASVAAIRHQPRDPVADPLHSRGIILRTSSWRSIRSGAITRAEGKSFSAVRYLRTAVSPGDWKDTRRLTRVHPVSSYARIIVRRNRRHSNCNNSRNYSSSLLYHFPDILE